MEQINSKFPIDWSELNLGKCSLLKARIGWQGLTTAEYKDIGEYFLITGTDFKDGYIDWDNCVYVDKERYVQDKYIQVKDNDVLVTKDGTIGKVALIINIPKPTTLNSGVFVIRPIDGAYDPRFFYYIMMSNWFKLFLNKLTAGSTISHLYQKDFVHFNFFIPPTLTEQKSIATALSDVDELINSLDKLISKKKAIKQGAMQELLKPKEGENLSLSKGWEVKKLGEICEIFKGKGISKSQISESGKNECILYGELFTTYKEVILCVVSKTNIKESILSKKGDILYPGSTTTTGIDLAKASVIMKDNILLGGDIIVLRKAKYNYNSIFLAYFLNEVKRYDIAQMTKGITIHHLYGKDLANIYAEFPSIEQQNETATILSDMDTEIEVLEGKKNKYQKIKQGMMQELLTGKTRLL